MEAYITLAAGMLLMPCIYYGVIMLCRTSFKEEKNQNRKPFHSIPELIVMLLAEIALVRIWWSLGRSVVTDVTFELLFLMLTAMTVLCMTDYWEKVVPNRILLVLVFLFIIILGLHGLRNMAVVLEILPSISLGFIFCALSFGLGYIISHRNMGAGDVKLALVMGLYLTGEYVVGAILYGCIAAALFSVFQLLRKRVSRKDLIPFVPFLYIGLIIKYLIG